MKSFSAQLLLASVALVGAQISALPPCGISCGLQAANATSCTPITNFNCTCQYSNQAIILPILESCLAKSCTDAAQSSAAISAGEVICATVSQTASGTAAPISKATGSVTGSNLPSASASSSAATRSGATYTSSSAVTTASPAYTGAATLPKARREALVAAAGMAMLAL